MNILYVFLTIIISLYGIFFSYISNTEFKESTLINKFHGNVLHIICQNLIMTMT